MKSIAIISEGISPTSQEISLRLSQVFTEIGYDTEIIFIGDKEWRTHERLVVDKNDFSVKKETIKKFDCAYIYSEGKKTKGYIQGYLGLLDIPYISSSPLTTMLATNKYFCKKYLEGFGILTPKSIKLNRNNPFSLPEIVKEIGFPCIVKPNIGTDSILVEKVDNLHFLEKSIDAIFKQGEDALIEEFIKGKEITCGVISLMGAIQATPVTEIFTEGELFYNYHSKIHQRNFKQTPAHLTDSQYWDCQNTSTTIFKLLECDDFVRVDYILQDDLFYFLEINITPGMSRRSNLPLQLNFMGIDINYFFDKMIQQNLVPTTLHEEKLYNFFK